MINSVRNAVLSIVNKNNFGYITPDDFNLYAKQAQLDIFENYFYQYNSWIVKQNARQSGSGYSDVVKHLEEVIDSFSTTATLVYDIPSGTFDLPSDYYYLNSIRYNGVKEIDRVTQDKLLYLLSSNLTSPSTMFPVYAMESASLTVYPDTIDSLVKAQYVRMPKDPKWTYTTIVGGSPLFDQSASDYQDFEIPAFDEVSLISKILQYAGISIREADVYSFGTSQETANKQIEG
jgi:hypothetical protein